MAFLSIEADELNELLCANARLAERNVQLEREHREWTDVAGGLDRAGFMALQQRVAEAGEAIVEAKRVGRIKDDFLALLSHELRTPLASVLMHVQLLRRGELPAGKITRALESIERGARLQVRLIDDLLYASRIVAGGLELESRACDVCAVVREAVEDVRPSSEHKGVAITCALDEAVEPIHADTAGLRKVLASLLANAVKFTAAAGHVEVRLTSSEGRVQLRVQDDGCGIAPEFLPRIFDRLVQQDESPVRKHGGLGLGLAIAKHIVTGCGGTLTADSPGIGRGATFSASFPVSGATSSGESAGSGMARALDRPGHTRQYAKLRELAILIVDDDAATREAIVEVLELSGAEVRSADSAAAAMQVLEDFEPKVVVSDIMMPDEDGYSFVRRLRQSRPRHVLRTIALTALASEGDRALAFAAGFDAHVSKPVDIDRLRDAVAEVLEH